MLDSIRKKLLQFSLFRHGRSTEVASINEEDLINRGLAIQKQWVIGSDPYFEGLDGKRYKVDSLAVSQWVGKDKEEIDASTGSNGFMPPESITRQLREIDEDKLAHYGNHLPPQDFIQPAADYLVQQGILEKGASIGFSPYDTAYTADYYLIIGNGTTALFSSLMRILIKTKGDVIVSTAPTYGLFVEPILSAGGKIEFLFLNEKNDYKPKAEELVERIAAINATLREEYLEAVQCLKELCPYDTPHFSGIEKLLKEEGSFDKLDTLCASYNHWLRENNSRAMYDRLNLMPCPRVRGYFHINPHMPFGNVLTQAEINALAKELRVVPGITIVDDLSYHDVILDPCKKTPGTFAKSDLKSQVVTLYGASKQYALPGVRTGIALGSQQIIGDLAHAVFKDANMINVYSIEAMQQVVTLPSDVRKDYLQDINGEYALFRDLSLALLQGLSVVPKARHQKIKSILIENKIDEENLKGIQGLTVLNVPDAGFFLMIDFSFYKNKFLGETLLETSMDFYDAFRYLAQLITLPGELSCYFEKPVLRFSFSLGYETIIEAILRMKKVLACCQDNPLSQEKKPILIQYPVEKRSKRKGAEKNQEEVPSSLLPKRPRRNVSRPYYSFYKYY